MLFSYFSALVIIVISLSEARNEKWVWHMDPKHRRTWVFLIAGSNKFSNYRHQADVCHAYHVVREHGIPATNIITMMYDDIAYNPRNPYPGKIFNEPYGPNVYKDVIIDYKGDAVTPSNIIGVLTGNKSEITGGSGRVIESNEDDNIFVYYSDHGSPGLLMVIEEIITAKEILDAVQEMYRNKRYHELVFYVEACESGSIFLDLPENINVYAVTAANATESSWACYCPGIDGPPMPLLHSCLGDLFSVEWMQDADHEDLRYEQLSLQYRIVKDEVTDSNVCVFGDSKISYRLAAEFMGWQEPHRKAKLVQQREKQEKWPSRDIPLLLAERSYMHATDPEAKKYDEIKEKRAYVDKFMESFASNFSTIYRDEVYRKRSFKTIQLDCHHVVVKEFTKKCFNFGKSPYVSKYGYILVNLCELNPSAEKILKYINEQCVNIKYNDVV